MDGTYKDDDFVYVDPDTRTVVGLVQWSKNGTPKPLPRPSKEREEEGEGEEKRHRRKRYFPWGSYRSMKKLFHLEGKEKEAERSLPLEEALAKAQKEPYWDTSTPAPAGAASPVPPPSSIQ
ncbi:MAG: hypothetical protein PHI23_01035 [Candidatus Peribacteraceae bacterium]|nr:hypothetical protein [Candidatus Peribacteraceae bacterium]